MAESEEDRAVRERLVTRWAGRLSDAELVSIVIRERIKTEPAIDTARRLLAGVDGSLTRLAGLSFRELRSSCGLGATRAAMLLAALELGRRLRFEGVSEVSRIEGTQDVVRMFRPLVTGLSHEEFWVLYLTAGNRVLDRVRVSQGGVAGTVVDYKIVVKRAVELLASSLILVHNHPSGVARPSEEDRMLTDKLVAAASLFDISVLDHLVITDGDHFSFRQEGLVG